LPLLTKSAWWLHAVENSLHDITMTKLFMICHTRAQAQPTPNNFVFNEACSLINFNI